MSEHGKLVPAWTRAQTEGSVRGFTKVWVNDGGVVKLVDPLTPIRVPKKPEISPEQEALAMELGLHLPMLNSERRRYLAGQLLARLRRDGHAVLP